MEICVIGAGYVGLVTAVCVAEFGHNVRCLDIDEEKVDALKAGKVPFYEPGLEEVMERNIQEGRFLFTIDIEKAVKGAKVVYLAVGTPMNPDDGSVDLSYIEQAARDIAKYLPPGAVVVDKSTVPVGTAEEVKKILLGNGAPSDIEVVSNPEFLREGTAVNDFMEPDRIVIGSDSKKAAEVLKRVYHPLEREGREFLVTSPKAAELIKYASNAFLALKLTFVNELAFLADNAGIDIFEVVKGVGLDKRIGPKFMKPGPGYGGSCLPKDTNGLFHIAKAYNSNLKLVETAIEINSAIPGMLVNRISKKLDGLSGKKIGLLGLAFKAGTDDVRESPAIAIARELLKTGAGVKAYDPEGMSLARRELGDSIEYAKSGLDAVTDADVTIVATEWPQFQGIAPEKIKEFMRGNLLADLRNLFDPEEVEAAGLRYMGVGRGCYKKQ